MFYKTLWECFEQISGGISKRTPGENPDGVFGRSFEWTRGWILKEKPGESFDPGRILDGLLRSSQIKPLRNYRRNYWKITVRNSWGIFKRISDWAAEGISEWIPGVT